MTRSHRRSHLAAWIILSPAILGVLIAALAVRARARAQLVQDGSHRGAEGTRP